MNILEHISILELPPPPPVPQEENLNKTLLIRIEKLESQLADALDAIAKFQKVYDYQREIAHRNKKLSTIQENLRKATAAKEDARAIVFGDPQTWLASPGGIWNDKNRRNNLYNDANALVTKLQEEYNAESQVLAKLPPLTDVQYS
jgi:hypothetical protein